MTKINYKSILNGQIATSRNFSDIESEMSHLDEESEFDPGDNGRAQDLIFSNIQADALLMNLLYSFNDREKIILLYQVLRESGYNLNHKDCAKTLSISREHYMFLLAKIKVKARKILQPNGY